MSFRWKLTLFSGGALILTVLLLLTSSIFSSQHNERIITQQVGHVIRESTQKLVDTELSGSIQQLSNTLSIRQKQLKLLADQILAAKANTLKNYLPGSNLRSSILAMLKAQLLNDDHAQEISVVFKMGGLGESDMGYLGSDYLGSNNNGQFAAHWSRLDGKLKHKPLTEKELSSPAIKQSILCGMLKQKTCIDVPMGNRHGFWISVPIIEKGKAIGVAAVHMDAKVIAQQIANINQSLYQGASQVFLVNQQGQLINKDNKDSSLDLDVQPLLRKNEVNNSWNNQQHQYVSFHPITIPALSMQWAMIVKIPQAKILASQHDLTQQLRENTRQGLMRQSMVGALVALIMLVAAWFLTGPLVKPLLNLRNELEKIASGEADLTQQVPVTSKDEIGQLSQSFNVFIGSLRQLIQDVVGSVADMKQNSKETITLITKTTDHVTAQFQQIDQVATAVEEFAISSKEVASNTQQTSTTINNAQQSVQEGQLVADQSQQAMNTLSEQLVASSQRMQDLAKTSEQISEILSVIQNISEQTNLLALNAAIEAARAGEHGRGFAVVASEVRSLASRTQASIVDVEDVINQLQNGTQTLVTTIQDANDAAQKTADQVVQTNTMLSNIAQLNTEVLHMAEQIASAAEQQSAVANEISESVNQIRDVAQEVTSSSEQTQHIGYKIESLAGKQHQLVSRFKV